MEVSNCYQYMGSSKGLEGQSSPNTLFVDGQQNLRFQITLTLCDTPPVKLHRHGEEMHYYPNS